MSSRRCIAVTCSAAIDARAAGCDVARPLAGASAGGEAERTRSTVTKSLRRWGVLAAALAFASFSPLTRADDSCGSLENGYGPFDYYTHRDKLPIVERHHFTADVEFLRKHLTGPFGADIDYTLRAFPNHPRALGAMIRLGELEQRELPAGARYSIYCYIERAIRFRPNDGNAQLMMATFLLKKGRGDEAAVHLERAVALAGDDGNLHYNLGLAFYRLQRWDEALIHAHTAYRLGFDLPGLRKLLTAAGKWQEPPGP
jgi:tetratricopeptide (TPR) repeat protein